MLDHNNKIICNDHELVESQNLQWTYYINIIEKYIFDNDKQAVDIILKTILAFEKLGVLLPQMKVLMITQPFRL